MDILDDLTFIKYTKMSSLKDSFDDKANELSKSIDDKTNAISKSIDDKKNEISKDIGETKDSIKKSVGSGVKKTKNFFKKLMWILLIGGALAAAGYYLFATTAYSKGTRTGYLIKMSEKGVVFKTMEGQMNLGGIASGEDASLIGNIWDFSVRDQYLYKKLASLEGKKVTLSYEENFRKIFWHGDTKYFIFDVEEK